MASARTASPPSAAPAHMSELTGKARLIAVLGILLGLLLSSLDQTIVGTAMPRIITQLGGLEHYAWVSTAYLLTSTASVPIFGKLSDTYGRKWFYVGGILLFMIASALCGASQTMIQLVVFRGLQGIAGGILVANAFAIIGDIFPPAERAKWQGVTGSVFGLSSVVGPALGGWLTDGPGWRWVFYINIPVGILAMIVLMIGLPQIRSNQAKPIDWSGATAIVSSAVPLLLAFTFGGTEYPWMSWQVIGLLTVAIVSGIAFVLIERSAADPIIPLDLFKSRTYVVSIVTIFFLGAGMFGAIMYIPLFMQTVVGASATSSGLVLTPMMLSLVAASTLSGQAIARTGRYKWAVVTGLTLMLLGMFLLSRMGTGTSRGEAVRNMIVLGMGIGMIMPTITLAVQSAFPANRIGVTTASVQFFRSIGATIGVALMGTVLSRQLGDSIRTDLPSNVTQAVSADVLRSINPQVLASPDALAQLQASVERLPDGAALFTELMLSLRDSVASAIHDVFLLATIVGALAFMIGMFLPERPLRSKIDPGESVSKAAINTSPDAQTADVAAGEQNRLKPDSRMPRASTTT